jgi:hypothetical protein
MYSLKLTYQIKTHLPVLGQFSRDVRLFLIGEIYPPAADYSCTSYSLFREKRKSRPYIAINFPCGYYTGEPCPDRCWIT